MKHKMAKTKTDAAGAIKSQLKIKAEWRPVAGNPSPALRRLWDKLLASREGKASPTAKDAGEGKCKDENERKLPDF